MNNETIAVNQDPWTLPAFRIGSSRSSGGGGSCVGEQWARHLSNGDIAVLILNREDNATVNTRLDFADFEVSGGGSAGAGAGGAYRVRDIQLHKDLGVMCQHAPFVRENLIADSSKTWFLGKHSSKLPYLC